MAEVKNTFLRSKMNKDLDARLVPNGEYRQAQNININKSEGDDVGAIENILGNTKITDFGLLSSNSSLIYNLVTVLIGLVILILCYVTITLENTDKLIFSIIIGGAFGNFYDRVFFKAVPDFLDLHYNSFHWFTFNVADIFITLGILGFIVKGFFEKK